MAETLGFRLPMHRMFHRMFHVPSHQIESWTKRTNAPSTRTNVRSQANSKDAKRKVEHAESEGWGDLELLFRLEEYVE